MAVNNINSYSSTLRLNGLGGSGLDTDTIVSQLMKAERVPLDKLYQKKQLAEWKRDDYRSITNLLRGLKDDFFNVIKPASNMLSQSSYIKYKSTSSDDKIVTVSGNSASTAGTHSISVKSIATAGKAESSSGVTDPLLGAAVSNYNLAGKKLKITLDGVAKEITLSDYTLTAGSPATSNMADSIQNLLDTAFGSGKISVSFDGSAGDSGKLAFNTVNGASRITLAGGDALASLGFTAGATNRLDISKSLDDLKTAFANDLTFNADGKLKFKINSVEFTFDKSVSLSSMMSTINSNTDAKVNMQYDETTNKFILTSKDLGSGENIIIDAASQGGNFFGTGGASGIKTGNATTKLGDDAVVKIDGQLVTRSTNSFAINGVTYNLIKAHPDWNTQSETVSLSLDTDSIYNNIKAFVDKYNDVISAINTKLGEKYDRNYPPLTDEQKSSMEADDIKIWEDKAKTGLLKNDSILQDIVYTMRRALSDSIGGISSSLSSIGITTGSYTEQGKLVIDETKLRAAISNDPKAVSDMFSKQSSISYSGTLTYSQRTQRYAEGGFASRLSDIIEDNIRTIGGKGKLLEKAGIQGDMTEYTSMIYNEIDGYNKNIASLVDVLSDKENRYYAKFTAMEQAISRMNSQSSWLSSQLGSNS